MFKKLVFVLAGCCLIACDQNYKEGAHPSPIPPVSAQQMPANHPVTTPPAPTPPTGEVGADAVVGGTIDVDPALLDKLPDDAVLYLIIRPAPTGGPPIAIKRLALPAFPYTYGFSNADAGMMPGQEIDLKSLDALYLFAKIDLDGKVGAPQPGDMEGACARNPVVPGDLNANILIDKVH